MNITRKQVVRYAVMPEFMPRLKALFYSGFQHIPFLIALVYQTVRLLPANHPYGNPANAGKFGIRHVIAEAANNLVISRNNIDQILMFFVVLIGMGIAIVQLITLGLAFFIEPVMAQEPLPTSFRGFFVTANPQQDIAFMLLDLVFGVPGAGGTGSFFGSCVADAAVNCVDMRDEDVQRLGGADWASPEGWMLTELGWPHPIHYAMRQLFQWYSFGLLIVAALITLYFMATVALETSQTGTPFGKRYNKVWAIIRFVVAFGLLIPVGHGLNASQYIVLYAAKFGSSFATNGWVRFNKDLTSRTVNYLTTGSTADNMVSTPPIPDVGALLQFLFVARVCKEYHWISKRMRIEAFLVKDPMEPDNVLMINYNTREPTYQQVVEFVNGAPQAVIYFGELDSSEHTTEFGYVKPWCGKLILPFSDPRLPSSGNPPEPGPEIIQRAFWKNIMFMWGLVANAYDYAINVGKLHGAAEPDNTVAPPSKAVIQFMNEFFQAELETAIVGIKSDLDGDGIPETTVQEGAVDAQIASGAWAVENSLINNRGWGGAGIWYNKVAEMNGVVTAAAMNGPIISAYPLVMEHVLAEKSQGNQQVSPGTRYKPTLSGGGYVKTLAAGDLDHAKVYWEAFDLWRKAGFTSSTHTAVTGNAFNDMINSLFGTSGLYSLRNNEGTHPLAMLTGVGRSLVESAVKNIGFSMAAATTGAAFSFLDIVQAGALSEVAVGLFMTFAMVGMTAGFVLFYVIPFLPFIYFFFAVGGWVKGIFEAMVGAPLWATAHLRIDGEGLPGPAATNGYILILEVAVRPILIIFGMIASILTFSALVNVLNTTWTLVTANLGGFDVATEISTPAGSSESLADFLRGPIDEFFYTVIYTIIVYLMGMSSFKMIDLVPNNIFRWMGQSIQTFNDAREDVAEGLTSKAAVGSQQVVEKVGGGMEGLLKSAARAGGG